MKRIAGPVVVDVPDELADRTSYVFEARTPAPDPLELPPKPDRISLLWEELSEAVTPDDMVAHRRARIDELQGATKSIAEARIQGAFIEASALRADIDAGDERFSVLFAAFRWSPSILGTINLEVTTRNDAPALFGAIVASVRPASFAQAPEPGLVTRYAGDVAIDVPLGFRWPRTYLFSSDDERSRVLITTDDAEPGPVDFDAIVEVEGYGDELHIEIVSSGDRALPLGVLGNDTCYRVLRRDGDGAVLETRIIRRLVAELKDRSWLSILEIERDEDPAASAAGWDAMIDSLSPSGQVP